MSAGLPNSVGTADTLVLVSPKGFEMLCKPFLSGNIEKISPTLFKFETNLFNQTNAGGTGGIDFA
jgi:hypothetical protein